MKIPPAILSAMTLAALAAPGAASADAVIDTVTPAAEGATVGLNGKPLPAMVAPQAEAGAEEKAVCPRTEECEKGSEATKPARLDDCPGCGLG